MSSNVSRLEKVLILLETKLNRPDADDGADAVSSGPALPAVDAASLPSLPVPAAAAAGAGAAAVAVAPPPSALAADAGPVPVPPPVAEVVAPPPPAVNEYVVPEVLLPYHKMFKFRLPEGAVRQKMSMNGLDPSLLDDYLAKVNSGMRVVVPEERTE